MDSPFEKGLETAPPEPRESAPRAPAPHASSGTEPICPEGRPGRPRRRGTRGQALTEFILVIPLFLVLLLGVVQLSLLSFAQQMVHYAAFAATRAAIVRPCMAFHPDNDSVAHFTPTVFSAAILSTMAAAPAHNLFAGLPYNWLPELPNSQEILDLDVGDGAGPVGGPGELALYKYTNAAYLTTVVRVEPNYMSDPVRWDQRLRGPGPGFPCNYWFLPSVERPPRQQNVPPTGLDLSLEVVFLYPMRIPIVNRVFYGVFINFSSMAQSELGIFQKIRDPWEPIENVMPMPTTSLPAMLRYTDSVNTLVNRTLVVFKYPAASVGANIQGVFNARQWYPLPLRARCTLTVEGSIDPLVTFPWP